LTATIGSHPSRIGSVAGKAWTGSAAASDLLSRIISKSPNEMQIVTSDAMAVLLPNRFIVCDERTPAKKKSPKPSLIMSMPCALEIVGIVGNATRTGSPNPEICSAACTIVPVSQTSTMSKAVMKAAKMKTVFQVNRLFMYMTISRAKMMP